MDVNSWEKFVGKQVVIDTPTALVYIGILQEVGEHFLLLGDVDIYDARRSSTPKELYLVESRRFGVRKTRHQVSLRVEQVISVSKLEDIIDF